MRTAFWIMVVVSIVTGVYRIAFEPSILRMSDTYKDLAHVLVGGQIGVWAALRYARDKPAPQRKSLADVCLWSAIVLTVVEVICAVAKK